MADTKIQIKTAQQLLGALIDYATADDKLDKKQFEILAEDRYMQDRDVRHSRVNDFTNESLRGQGDDIVEKYRIANRVNNMSMDTSDIAYASFYAGVSAVGARIMSNAVNVSLVPHYITFLNYLKNDVNYEISNQAVADICEINNASGHAMVTDKAGIAYKPLDQLTAATQDNIAQSCMGAFFDKSIYGKDNNFNLTPAMKDFFNKAMAEGKKFLEAAYGGKDFTPETPEQEAALAHIKQLAKDNKKQTAFNDYQVMFENQLEAKVADILQNPERYANPGEPTMKFDRVPLLLEGTTREGFVSKMNNRGLPLPVEDKNNKSAQQIDPNDKEAIAQKAKEEAEKKAKEEAERRKYRSYAETEYGETVVDNLMKQFYLDDEIKDMNRHGIDPCTHIYVNGLNALDMLSDEVRIIDGAEQILTYRDYFAEKGEPTSFDYAKLKCDICAAALRGSKIDVVEHYKENGEYVPMAKATPVKVDAEDMDKEPVSLWKKILMFFGIIKSTDREIAKSNQLENHSNNIRIVRERTNFNELTANEAAPRTTEAVQNDRQIEHTNEL